MEKIRLAFIDSDLLYRGVLYRQWFAIYRCPLMQVWLYFVSVLNWQSYILIGWFSGVWH